MPEPLTAISACGAAIKIILDTKDRVSDIASILDSAADLLGRLESLALYLRQATDTYEKSIRIIGGDPSLSHALESHANNCYQTCNEMNRIAVSIKISRCPALRALKEEHELEVLATRLDREKSDFSDIQRLIR